MRALVVLLFMAMGPSSSTAHEVKHPKKVELHLHSDGLRLTVLYRTSPGPSSIRLRRDVDLDGSGSVDAHEKERLVKRLKGYATFGLQIQIDGKRLDIREESQAVSGVSGRVDSGQPLVLKLVFRSDRKWSEKSETLIMKDVLPIRSQMISGVCSHDGVMVDPCGSFHLSGNQMFRASLQKAEP